MRHPPSPALISLRSTLANEGAHLKNKDDQFRTGALDQQPRQGANRCPKEFTRLSRRGDRGGPLQLGKKVAGSIATTGTLLQPVLMHGPTKLVEMQEKRTDPYFYS